jgi:hypothetical protein
MERPPVWAVVVAALSLLVQPSADRRKGSTLARAQTGDAAGKGEDERGRGAATPSDIPLRGWKVGKEAIDRNKSREKQPDAHGRRQRLKTPVNKLSCAGWLPHDRIPSRAASF